MTFTRFAMVLMTCAIAARAEGSVRKLIISIPDRKLALVEDGKVVRVYPIAVGKPTTPSPSGNFKIDSHLQHPTWFGPRKVVPPGKANPLGTRWMGLGYKGYGIHGTNVPSSVGKNASHGCFRMRNQDVEELFELVKIGDAVEIHADPPAEVAKLFAPAPPVVQPVLTAAAGGGM